MNILKTPQQIIQKQNATIISIGNFNHNNTLKDAIGKIYLRCGDYALKYLKKFIRFYVDINYNPKTNLRMLQSKEQIEVIDTKILVKYLKVLFHMSSLIRILQIKQ